MAITRAGLANLPYGQYVVLDPQWQPGMENFNEAMLTLQSNEAGQHSVQVNRRNIPQ